MIGESNEDSFKKSWVGYEEVNADEPGGFFQVPLLCENEKILRIKKNKIAKCKMKTFLGKYFQ